MRVVIAAGFAHDLDFPAERLVTFLDDIDVFASRNGFVGVSEHGEDRDSGFGERGKGVHVIGFSYPVVPQGKARIRTQINAAHTREDLERAVAAFVDVRRELGIQ